MKISLSIIIFVTSIIATFVFAYNQALKDAASDNYFIDASKTFVALKLLREKGREETIAFLEGDLDSLIEINRNLVEVRSSYFQHLNFQFPMDYEYYEHMLAYRFMYPVDNDSTVKNLNWLISNANKSLQQDK